jgi:hypothetical protein
MVEPFPPVKLQTEKGKPDYNPAIQLFGRRFPSDQTEPELLLELVLVATSEKRIGDILVPQSALLPDIKMLRSWPQCVPLKYAPKSRLNLKLFAFLGASKLETRHNSHRQHYCELTNLIVQGNRLSISGSMDATKVLKTLENLFLGFQSLSGQRTWCAVSFLPVARELIAGESIWQASKVNSAKEPVETWQQALRFFSHNQQIFLARGGELLYLQICNALAQDPSEAHSWMVGLGISPSREESDLPLLHAALENALERVFTNCPETIGKLAEFVDTRVDPDTAEYTDFAKANEPRFCECGWCPVESWREGTLFTIELLRLCRATVDPIERLELLEIACALQVLRSLCAQSARYTNRSETANTGGNPLGYVWAISDPTGLHTAVKQISRRNVNAVQRLIYDALRHPSIRESDSLAGEDVTGIYREADSRYGHKLFLTMAKRIGLIVPKRGGGARFVLNDRILRCLVLATIRPGERVTYENFKDLLFAHYGIAVDDEAIGRSCVWSGTSRLTTLGGNADAWLIEMLDASGMLLRLSDACSLVRNPFDGGEEGL